MCVIYTNVSYLATMSSEVYLGVLLRVFEKGHIANSKSLPTVSSLEHGFPVQDFFEENITPRNYLIPLS